MVPAPWIQRSIVFEHAIIVEVADPKIALFVDRHCDWIAESSSARLWIPHGSVSACVRCEVLAGWTLTDDEVRRARHAWKILASRKWSVVLKNAVVERICDIKVLPAVCGKALRSGKCPCRGNAEPLVTK